MESMQIAKTGRWITILEVEPPNIAGHAVIAITTKSAAMLVATTSHGMSGNHEIALNACCAQILRMHALMAAQIATDLMEQEKFGAANELVKHHKTLHEVAATLMTRAADAIKV